MYSADRRRFSQESKPENRHQLQPTPFDSWDDPVEAMKKLKSMGFGAVKMGGRFARKIVSMIDNSLPKDPPRASSIE